MKKIIVCSVLFFGITAIAVSQDLTSKNGVPILPQEGEWCIGADAVPFFIYMGNFFNGNQGNGAPDFDFTGPYPMTLYVKHMASATWAMRGKLRISYNAFTDKEFITKDAETPDPDVTVEDKAKRSNMDIVLGAGAEMRRGKGRLQGVYGAEALIMFGAGKDKFEYGNTWDPDVPHFVTNFGDNYFIEYEGFITENKQGTTFGFGLRGFVGVEYFFAPKISLGGEFGWGPMITSEGKGSMTYEFEDINQSTGQSFINSRTIESGGESNIGLNMDNLSGAINLLFYF
jgi:hypothetical protein